MVVVSSKEALHVSLGPGRTMIVGGARSSIAVAASDQGFAEQAIRDLGNVREAEAAARLLAGIDGKRVLIFPAAAREDGVGMPQTWVGPAEAPYALRICHAPSLHTKGGNPQPPRSARALLAALAVAASLLGEGK